MAFSPAELRDVISSRMEEQLVLSVTLGSWWSKADTDVDAAVVTAGCSAMSRKLSGEPGRLSREPVTARSNEVVVTTPDVVDFRTGGRPPPPPPGDSVRK